MKHYHTTLKTREKKIQLEGLLVGKRRLWNNAFGSKQGHKKSIYLFSDLDDAIRWAGKMEWEFKKEIIIIELTKIDNTIKDNHLEMQLNYSTACKVNYNIPKENILKVIPLTRNLIKDLIKKGRVKFKG